MALPSNEFKQAFGSHIYEYAALEFGIKGTLGYILKIDTLEAFIIGEPYSSMALRNVAKSITKESSLSDQQKEKFVHILGEFGGQSRLRNYIAHSRWRKGDREGSLKPVGFDIRSGKAKMIGHDKDEKDYTAAEIKQEADKLKKLAAALVYFHMDCGFTSIGDLAQEAGFIIDENNPDKSD